MAYRPTCGPSFKVYSTKSGPTMAGSKTQPAAKCQLRCVPRMLVSISIKSLLRCEETQLSCRFRGCSNLCKDLPLSPPLPNSTHRDPHSEMLISGAGEHCGRGLLRARIASQTAGPVCG